jgi:hypothetical protein
VRPTIAALNAFGASFTRHRTRYFIARVGTSHHGQTGKRVHIGAVGELDLPATATGPARTVKDAWAGCRPGGNVPIRMTECDGDTDLVTCPRCIKWLEAADARVYAYVVTALTGKSDGQ